MRHRYLICSGMVLLGLLSLIEGIARIMSGTTNLYGGAKHKWLSGFFMIFGSYAPYASALLSLTIGLFFFNVAYRVIRSSEVEAPSSCKVAGRQIKKK